MDIATLGLEVRSDQVEKGTASLDRLSRAASRAQAAAMGVATGSRQAAAGSASVASSSSNAAGALEREAAAARRAQQALERQATASRAANDNARRMGGSMSGLAAQFQDIGVTAAMGMNPAIIALQQGTQIAGQMEFAMQGGAKATDVLGTAFRSLFSPLTFITIALTALAAAAFQMADWAATGAAALRGLASVLETVAPYAVSAAAALALIYAPTIVTGIVSIIALLGRLSVAALGTAASFTTAWLAAMGPVGWVIAGLAAVSAAAFLLRDEIKTALGVDLFGIIKDAGNFIINSFEMVYSDIKFMWGNFPDIFSVAMTGAVNFVVRGVNQMVKAATDGINALIRGVNNLASKFGADKAAEFFGFSGQIPEIAGWAGLSEWSDGGASQRLSEANRGQLAEYERIMGQDRLGQFGTAIASGASAASSKLKELATSLGAATDKKKGAKTEAEKLAEKYDKIVRGARQFIAEQELERQAIGMSAMEASRLRHEMDLLNQAKNAGITLTAAQTAELQGLAAQMAAAEQATKAAKDMQDAWNEAGRGFGGVLKGLIDGTMSWKDALQQVIPLVLKLFNDMNLAQGGKGIFGGGFFQNLIGGLLGIGFAKGGYTGNGPASGVAGVVHGKEYVFSAAATRKIGVGNLDAMHRAAKGYQSGGYVTPAMPRMHSPANDQPLRIEVVSRFDADGGFETAVERTSRPVAQTEAREASDKRVGAYNDQQRRGGAAVNERFYSGLKRRS